jgi:hypothetical protein
MQKELREVERYPLYTVEVAWETERSIARFSATGQIVTMENNFPLIVREGEILLVNRKQSRARVFVYKGNVVSRTYVLKSGGTVQLILE